jgi:hypothetical protein
MLVVARTGRSGFSIIVGILVFSIVALAATVVNAQSRNLAEGFSALQRGSTVAIMPPDVELYSISAGGVPEPKADWTDSAQTHIQNALTRKSDELGLSTKTISESDGDDLAEISTLHAAVARSISLHHMQGGNFTLPTKNGKLDWSLGEAVHPLRAKTGADYALFVWLRDSYASTERKVAMVAMAFLGVGLGGGRQVGYGSLVDLRTGQVMWFNQLLRGSGDLRETDPSIETVNALLDKFPVSK